MNFFRFCIASILTLVLSTAFAAETDVKQIESDVMEVLDEYLATFNASDSEALSATWHFPHFRLAQGTMQVWEIREDAIRGGKERFEALRTTGWHKTEWLEREIISISDSKVHVATKFRRLREDGSEIVTTESLYILIKQNGRWGIKLRSSYL